MNISSHRDCYRQHDIFNLDFEGSLVLCNKTITLDPHASHHLRISNVDFWLINGLDDYAHKAKASAAAMKFIWG